MRGSAFIASLEKEAQEWRARGLTRQRKVLLSPTGSRIQLEGKEGSSLSFLSNDYLGLAAHPDLRNAVSCSVQTWGAGSGASPLVSGNMRCHAHAEKSLAAFVGFEDALLFITGYMANLAVISSLLNSPDDVVFSDQLNHASLIDACRLSRGRIERYPHLDTDYLAKSLRTSTARRRLIVTDAVFSMDGDCAPLSRILALAEEFDALVLVDDAHGFGVRGPNGRGSLAEERLRSDRVIMMATLGKAAGLSGAFVAASAFLIEHFVQHARTYVFSTAPSPALVGAVPDSIRLIREADPLRQKLRILSQHLAMGVKQWKYPVHFHGTPIIPVLVGDENQAMRCAQSLADRGVFVAGIRPPTVPLGSSRLRISLSAAHEIEDIEFLIQAANTAGFLCEAAVEE